jgi:hypothetical protein
MKEAGGVQIAFEIQDDGRPLPGYQHVQIMMVARGDLTETPPALTYLSVVTRESVWIAFLIAALNVL